MPFDDISLESARAYFDLVRDREPFALIDLAGWLASTGGPIDVMDATIESLVPLWVWFKQQSDAGFPTVRPSSTPLRAAVWSIPQERYRSQVVAESMGFYAAQVIRNYDRRTTWEIDRRERSRWFNQPLLRFSDGSFFDVLGFCVNAAGQYSSADIFPLPDRVTVDSRLHDGVERALRALGNYPVATTRGSSVLMPMLGAPAHVIDYSAVSFPHILPRPPRVADKDRAGGEYILTIGDIDEDDEEAGRETLVDIEANLRTFPPLPTQATAEFLARAGFTDPQPPSVGALSTDPGPTFTHQDFWGYAECTTAGGQVRFIRFKPLESTRKEWSGLLDEVRLFGFSIGAELDTDREDRQNRP